MAASSRSKLIYPRPWKLRFASIALILKWLAGVAAIACLSLGFGLDDRLWLLAGLGAIGALVVFAAIGLVLGAELPCNICRNPLLIVKRCRKHESAKCFLGLSHPLGVAVPALFTARFHCMYCGEKIPLGKRRGESASVASDDVPVPRHPGGEDSGEKEPSLPAPR